MTIAIPSNRTITLVSKDGGGFQSAGLVVMPSIGWRGNEPAGFTDLAPREFSTRVESGWYDNNMPTSLLVDESSNYGVSGNVARCVYPTGYAGGSSPGSTGVAMSSSASFPSGSDEIYLCFEVRLSANWQGHSTGTNKIFYITMVEQGGGGDPAFISVQTDNNPAQLSARYQGTGNTNYPNLAFVSTVEFAFGEWHLVELWLKRNSGVGVDDGAYRVWVDSKKTQEDLACEWYAEPGARWTIVKWDPIWGGGGDTVSEEMYMDISRVHVGAR